MSGIRQSIFNSDVKKKLVVVEVLVTTQFIVSETQCVVKRKFQIGSEKVLHDVQFIL